MNKNNDNHDRKWSWVAIVVLEFVVDCFGSARASWTKWNERAYHLHGYMHLQTFAVDDQEEYDTEKDVDAARQV